MRPSVVKFLLINLASVSKSLVLPYSMETLGDSLMTLELKSIDFWDSDTLGLLLFLLLLECRELAWGLLLVDLSGLLSRDVGGAIELLCSLKVFYLLSEPARSTIFKKDSRGF